MANLRRTDSSSFTQHADTGNQYAETGQTPIVLARLPRLGAGSSSVQTATRTTTVAPPLPQPETMPELELREQISQRIKLHVAHPPSSPAAHFADRQQDLQAEPILRQPAPAPAAVRAQTYSRPANAVHTSQRTPATQRSPASLSHKLYQLHDSLSPHAGLIVAFALIASAALLYWMIVGPSQAPGPLYHEFGNTMEQDRLGAAPPPMTEGYLPQFAAELPQAEATTPSTNHWNRIELPQPAATQPTRLHQTTLKSAAREPATRTPASIQEPAPTSDSSAYPTTSFPQQLDLSKAMQTPMTPANSDVARGLPEIANRSTDSTTR